MTNNNWEKEARDVIAEAMTCLLENIGEKAEGVDIIIENRNKILDFIRKTRQDAQREVLGEVRLRINGEITTGKIGDEFLTSEDLANFLKWSNKKINKLNNQYA